MLGALLDFGYVQNMNPRAALHMGFLLGASGKKALDFGLQKAGEYRKQKNQN